MKTEEDKWVVFWSSGNTISVVPLDDWLGHFDNECPCLPNTEVELDADGEFAAFMEVHNAWDGRE